MTARAPAPIVAAFLTAASLAVSACGPGPSSHSPVTLQAFDPELLTDARTLVFSFSTTRVCADLMDLAPDALGELLQDEEPPLQLLDGASQEHVFGKVTPDVPIAYFVLASARSDFGQAVALRDLKGTVFGMACRELEVKSGTRQDLPMTLFPVGLR
jgi:hypothetical protein